MTSFKKILDKIWVKSIIYINLNILYCYDSIFNTINLKQINYINLDLLIILHSQFKELKFIFFSKLKSKKLSLYVKFVKLIYLKKWLLY